MSESPQGLDGISLNNGPVEWINKHVNPDYFVPNPLRAYHYLTLDRSVTTFHPNFSIPIGNTDSMLYQGKDIGGVNDRPISSYQNSLFPEEYHHDKNEESQIKGWTAEYMLRDENR